jgi:hypothetical protein
MKNIDDPITNIIWKKHFTRYYANQSAQTNPLFYYKIYRAKFLLYFSRAILPFLEYFHPTRLNQWSLNDYWSVYIFIRKNKYMLGCISNVLKNSYNMSLKTLKADGDVIHKLSSNFRQDPKTYPFKIDRTNWEKLILKHDLELMCGYGLIQKYRNPRIKCAYRR